MINMKKTKLFLFLILVLSVIGIADSLHLLEIKYGEGVLNCDLNEVFNCGAVNHSAQSEFLGFPTAGIGLVGYSVLALMSLVLLGKQDWRKKAFFKRIHKSITPFSLMLVAALGLAIQLYYTHVEFFVLQQFCMFCLFSQALILGIAIFAYMNYRR